MLRLCLLILAFLPLMAMPSAAQDLSTTDAQNYRRALQALDTGRLQDALTLASHARDPVLAMVVRAEVMAAPASPFAFPDYLKFIEANPHWPIIEDIRRMAEERMPDDLGPQAKVNWFHAHPALSLHGFYHQIDALLALGREDETKRLITARWTEGDFNRDELAAFYARFGRFLAREQHWMRIDRLLANDQKAEAEAMFPYVDADIQAVARARIALAEDSPAALTLLAAVPHAWQQDQGLLLQQLRLQRKRGDMNAAIMLLTHQPPHGPTLAAWWNERHILIRRLIDQRQFTLAYRLAAEHGQKGGLSLAQGEFMAGWLALRFLNQPRAAATHFQRLYDATTTPVSKARGAYWLGRSLEAGQNAAAARQAYELAATYPTTYHGQLASARIYPTSPLGLNEVSISAKTREGFWRKPMPRAAWQLLQLGDERRARRFFDRIGDDATTQAGFVLLAQMAIKLNHPEFAVRAAKNAAQKNLSLGPSGYPLLKTAAPPQPERALIHAIIRQESMFRPDVVSPAGARGVMQLMPGTARALAKQMGIKKHKDVQLNDPSYNIKLGSAYLQQRLDQFNGSVILAAAAYNAGQGRVRQWLDDYGDPRNGTVDPIDWIEMIPIYETRTYVQRVIENLQIYRARLDKTPRPSRIMRDLAAGS